MKGIFEPVTGIAGSLIFNELCHSPVDDLDLYAELQLARCCATVLPSISDHVLATLANGSQVEKLRALRVLNLYYTHHKLEPALSEGQRYQITQANLAILKLETPPRLLREAIPLAEQSELSHRIIKRVLSRLDFLAQAHENSDIQSSAESMARTIRRKIEPEDE